MRRFRLIWSAGLLALAAGLAHAPAAAQIRSGSDRALPVRSALVDGWEEAPGQRLLGFAVSLAPGWKTYWRAPGELGIPPGFDWSDSDNVADVEVLWPVPRVFRSGESRYAGYAGRALLPLRVRARDPARPMHLRLTASFGVCEDICIPAEARLDAVLPPGAPRGADAEAIAAALARLPVPAREAGLRAIECRLSPAGPDAFELEAVLHFDGPPEAVEMAAIEAPVPDLWIAAPEIQRGPGLVRLRARLDYLGTGPLALDRDSLRFTLIGPGRAIEQRGCRLPG
ncbi:MAG: hypothetical protein D6686_16270 [Alphaproteobacteria bacterium]|nr:MAG: hypothetical protein D6686_16270 [Alphaproteobacteria bacterium]